MSRVGPAAAWLIALGALWGAGYLLLTTAFGDEPKGATAGVVFPAERPERAPVEARRGVFRLETQAGPLGTAFVGWVGGGRARLVTAYPAARAVVADGFGQLIVRRGNNRWRATAIASDKLTGLVLLRIEGRPGAPLWTAPEPAGIAAGDDVTVVPAGGDPVSGRISEVGGAYSLEAPWSALHLGAPVLAQDGRLAGVVSGTGRGGELIVTPIEHACGRIRRC